jgi:protein MPE1
MGTSAAEALTGDHRIEAGAKDAMLAKARGLQGRGGTFGSLSRRFDGKEEKKVSGRCGFWTE